MSKDNSSKVYAKAIYELGHENNIDVAKELTDLTEIINASNDLENLLFLEVFTVVEKLEVTKEIFKKQNFSQFVQSFVLFLIGEGRINTLPEIFKDVIVLDDHKKGFLRGTIEGANDQASEAFLAKIKVFLQEKLGHMPILSYLQNNEITAGYRVTVEDLQLDATLDNQLNNLKDYILNA